MKVKVTYLKSEFDAAIDFIIKNNNKFEGTKSDLTKSLFETIKSMDAAAYGSISSRGSLGYLVRVNEILMESSNTEKCEVMVGIDIDHQVFREKDGKDSEEDYDWLGAFLDGIVG